MATGDDIQLPVPDKSLTPEQRIQILEDDVMRLRQDLKAFMGLLTSLGAELEVDLFTVRLENGRTAMRWQKKSSLYVPKGRS